MDLADLIRTARLRLRLSQEELANRVGVSRQAVQQWEKAGGTGPNRKIRLRVAEVLGLPASAIDPMASASVTPVEDSDDRGATVPLYALSELYFNIEPLLNASLGAVAKLSVAVDQNRCFAVRVDDDSMAPNFVVDDIVIVDPGVSPEPQDDVVVAFDSQPSLLRRYVPRGLDKHGRRVFDLTTPNADCVTLTCHSDMPVKVLGVVVEVRRRLARK
jgi:SOS-response transcriptional repressor LexA